MACKKCEAGTTGPGHTCTVAERVMHKVRQVGRCWEWTGASNGVGYGEIRLSKTRMVYTHRLAYELTWGPIPEGMVIAHRCDNPRCLKPSHLFPATQAENMQDMVAKGRARRRIATHCPLGHAYPATGRKRCRECENARRRRPGGRGPYHATQAA